jgi:hypothetical protein
VIPPQAKWEVAGAECIGRADRSEICVVNEQTKDCKHQAGSQIAALVPGGVGFEAGRRASLAVPASLIGQTLLDLIEITWEQKEV